MIEMDTLTFKIIEKIFSNGAVVRVALTGHTLAEMKAGQTLTVSIGIILKL